MWQAAGDQSYFPPGGIHMNDDPAKPNWMYVGNDGSVPADVLTDVPEGAWIHVDISFDAASDFWQTTVSYASGSGGGTFSGTRSDVDVVGEFWFGGWAFKSTMDAAPIPPAGRTTTSCTSTTSRCPRFPSRARSPCSAWACWACWRSGVARGKSLPRCQAVFVGGGAHAVTLRRKA